MNSEGRVRVFVGAGSNIEPQAHLRAAIAALENQFSDVRLSSVFRTSAVGFDGPDFLNLVVSFDTELPVAEVIEKLDAVEAAAGRRRTADRFSSRTLDLDLLMYGEGVVRHGDLTLPREDIVEYAFVLGPMAELAPDLLHPVEGMTMGALWDRFDGASQPITKLEEGLD